MPAERDPRAWWLDDDPFDKKNSKEKFIEKIKNHKFMEIKIDEMGAKLINFT